MRVGPRVAATAYDGKVYLAHLPDGPIHVLEGTAALIWSHALSVPRSQLAAAVTEEVEGDPATIRAGVAGFVDSLLRQRLLVEDGEG
jgi:hypothetical protein